VTLKRVMDFRAIEEQLHVNIHLGPFNYLMMRNKTRFDSDISYLFIAKQNLLYFLLRTVIKVPM